MREFYKLLIIALSVCSFSFPQISDITRLPVQNPSQSIKESAPVWLSENEILIFYVSETLDTIYSTRSTDRGNSWDDPEVIQVVGPNRGTFLSAIKTSTERILLAWSDFYEGMYFAHSDDNGENWSQPNFIAEDGMVDLNLSELEDGRIIFSYVYIIRKTAYFNESTDNGTTWSPGTKIFQLKEPLRIYDLSINSIDSSTLMATFSTVVDFKQGIYKCLSYDDGETWTDTIRILNTDLDVTRPKIIKNERNEYLLAYLVEETIWFGGEYKQNDIFYLKSNDNGETWIDKTRFTKYIGQDEYLNISVFSDKTFLTFSTERFTNDLQISYAILEETVEIRTPPKILEYGVPEGGIDLENREFIYQIKVLDDEAIEEVALAINDSVYKYELYDDGMHDDELANDGIYGNKLPIIELSSAETYRMEVNKILLPMDNKGVFADVDFRKHMNVNIKPVDNSGYFTKAHDVVNYQLIGSGGMYGGFSFLFSSGFFLSGYSNGQLWANAVASASLVQDYLPGTVNSNPEDPIFNLYVINKDDVPFGYSWQKWKDAVMLGAEFYDGDGDGIYNPVDKNWNGTWEINEDMPFLLGDVTAWCVYNDGKPDSLRRWLADPQGIEIRQTVFGSSNPELENVLFIKYSVMNTGTVAETMDSVYLGIWEDADLGDATDDVVGCDTLLQSGYYYNNNPDFRYGEDCPSFFTTYLQCPSVKTGNFSDTAKSNFGQLVGFEQTPGAKNLSMSSHVFHIGGDPFLNDPSSINEAVNYLKGKTRIGDYPDPCTFPYCQVRGGVNCSEINPLFWASGDPVTDIGWINRFSVDHRNIISTGPFNLEKDKPQEIIVAYVIGRGTDYFNSITVARENVRRAIAEYESNFATMTYSPPPPTNPVTNYVLYQNYPNPFNPTTTIRYELPQDGLVTIDIYDILGQKVRTILNEFKKADRYEINYNSIGLASGVYIYRMKVNDYTESKKMLLLK